MKFRGILVKNDRRAKRGSGILSIFNKTPTLQAVQRRRLRVSLILMDQEERIGGTKKGGGVNRP